MHANPERVRDQERGHISQLRTMPRRNTLTPLLSQFLRLLRLAFWRAFQHDAFAIAKASAYSSILTFFPLLLVVGSVSLLRAGPKFICGKSPMPWDASCLQAAAQRWLI